MSLFVYPVPSPGLEFEIEHNLGTTHPLISFFDEDSNLIISDFKVEEIKGKSPENAVRITLDGSSGIDKNGNYKHFPGDPDQIKKIVLTGY